MYFVYGTYIKKKDKSVRYGYVRVLKLIYT